MPKQPWELRDSDEREADTQELFILFCEDEVSEPCYFRIFEKPGVKITIIENQKNSQQNINRAISHCRLNGLVIEKNGKSFLVDDSPNVWCVFDRDKDHKRVEHDEKVADEKLHETQTLLNNESFNLAIQTAESAGIKVAWSNDNFELWVLLHFEDVDLTTIENRNRVTYYKRLTEVFKNIQGIEALTKKTQHPNFYYKDSFKSKSDFIQIVRPHLESEEKREAAIKRAKALEAHYSNDQPNHEKAPCTMVHHLVEALLLAGGKSIGGEI